MHSRRVFNEREIRWHFSSRNFVLRMHRDNKQRQDSDIHSNKANMRIQVHFMICILCEQGKQNIFLFDRDEQQQTVNSNQK